MAETIEHHLEQIGLDEKEAKIYLAVLELGPSPVQNVAQRAGVPRATTYLVLDDLKRKGLVTTFERGKKSFFVAESPDHLLELVQHKARALREQEEILRSLIPDLAARGQFEKAHRPAIRFYEGPRGIKALINDNLRAARGEILSIFSTDDADSVLHQAGITAAHLATKRKRAHLRRRAIYTWRKTPPAPGRVQKGALYIPYDIFPCAADIGIYGDRVAVSLYDEPLRAVAIEDRKVAEAFRVLFNVLWNIARHSPRRPSRS